MEIKEELGNFEALKIDALDGIASRADRPSEAKAIFATDADMTLDAAVRRDLFSHYLIGAALPQDSGTIFLHNLEKASQVACMLADTILYFADNDPERRDQLLIVLKKVTDDLIAERQKAAEEE